MRSGGQRAAPCREHAVMPRGHRSGKGYTKGAKAECTILITHKMRVEQRQQYTEDAESAATAQPQYG